MSRAYPQSRIGTAHGGSGLDAVRILHTVLLAGFLIYTFIGTSPLASADVSQRVEGNALDRLAVFALAAIAMIALAADWRRAAAMVVQSPGLVVLIGFAVASVLWSDHPDLTLRRAMLLGLLAIVAAGLAVGVRDIRQFHTAVFAGLTVIVLVNLASVALWPALTITDLGVRGLYTQKNVAGIVAMLAIVTGLTWAAGAAARRNALIGIAALAPSAAFLLLSQSKTSIMLTALGGLSVGLFVLVEKGGPRAAMLLVTGALGTLAAALIAFAFADFDAGAISLILTGDATFTGRDELWSFALHRAEDRFWLGHGYGAFWDVGLGADPLTRVDPGSWLGDIEIGTINQAHNGYLELWLHLGLPATLLAIIVVGAGMWRALRTACASGESRAVRASFGWIALILGLHLAHNLTEATLFMRGQAFCSLTLVMLFLCARQGSLARSGGGQD